MLFRHSAVKSLTRDAITEQASRMPVDIHPALLGTGELTLGLDATGLQGLNARLTQYRDAASVEHPTFLVERSIYIYRNRAISKHTTLPDRDETHPGFGSNMPCGWLDYDLEIDGVVYDTHRIQKEARDWSRRMEPRKGTVWTEFTLGAIRVSWTVCMPLYEVWADMRFAYESLDDQTHAVTLLLRCRQTLRHHEPIASGGLQTKTNDASVIRQWKGTNETSTAELMEPISLSWVLTADSNVTYGEEPDWIWAQWSKCSSNAQVGIRMICGSDRDRTETDEAAMQRVDSFLSGKIDQALAEDAQVWQAYFADKATVHIGDPEKEFLLLQAQYTLRAGQSWHAGVELGTLWTQKFNAATFWDTFFAGDGLLRAGHIAMVRDFCHWLVKTAKPTGRPHAWMTFYDGTPACHPHTDIAYFNCMALAGLPIRLYEMTRDETDLRECVYPYLKRLSTFLLEEIFVPLDEGGWSLGGRIAHDVDGTQYDAGEAKDILLWASMTIAKFAEYGSQLGEQSPLLDKARAIKDWFTEHPISIRNKQGMWGFWIPFLAPGGPLVDWSEWDPVPTKQEEDERAGPSLGSTYHGMPWSNGSSAASYNVVGQPDVALETLEGAGRFIAGMGYLTEGPYEFHCGGNSPYVPSSGAWMAAWLGFFADGSLWEDDIRIGVGLPTLYRCLYLQVERVRTLNGATVSLDYGPYHLKAEIESDRPRAVHLRIPTRMTGEPMLVLINGEKQTIPVAFIQDETVSLALPQGKHTVSIERDMSTAFDVLLIEPLDQGEVFKSLMQEWGLSVRWIRDEDSVKEVIDSVKIIVCHVSYVALAPETAMAIEDAVRSGATLLTLYHAGVSKIEPRLAEFTGVRADFETDWQWASSQRTYTLTEEGASRFSELAPTLQIPAVQVLTPNLKEDVTVLATDDGRPAVTHRHVGDGNVYWMATGNKMMDRDEYCRQFGIIRRLFVYGDSIEDYNDLKWLHSHDWQALARALLTADAD